MEFLSLLSSAAGNDIENSIKSLSIRSVLVASLLLTVLLLVSAKIVKKRKYKVLKKPLFILIAATIALPTLLMTASTIYLNTISDSGGPVHWHTDIEFWVCGQEVKLREPIGALSNKVGSSTYHVHNDKRIHLEGVVIDTSYDASLEKFMAVTGGEITNTSMIFPTNNSIFETDTDGDQNSGDQAIVRGFLTRDEDQRATLTVKNGFSCNDNDGYAEIQAFLYRYDTSDDTYTQTKLDSPKNYVMRDEPIVPPGDCVIVEFDTVKDRTDKLCKQYGIVDQDRCEEFGVENFNPELCKIREVNKPQSPGGEL